MESYGLDLVGFVLLLILERIIKYAFFLVFFFYVFGKFIVFIVIFRSIDVVIWVYKAYWIHLRYLYYRCSFGGTWYWSVNIRVEVFGPLSVFVVFNEVAALLLNFYWQKVGL